LIGWFLSFDAEIVHGSIALFFRDFSGFAGRVFPTGE
jgi:hypothetical protein